jgi:hypothetical protein
MQTTFDVPGHITLAMVSRPIPGETAEQRVIRLAMKAVIEGVTLIGSVQRRCLATSSRDGNIWYAVNVPEATCTCEGFAHSGTCKHLALALVERVLNPEPPTPVAAAA